MATLREQFISKLANLIESEGKGLAAIDIVGCLECLKYGVLESTDARGKSNVSDSD